jgi:Activator of Hsp90 ATPase homolog 1-like protein
VARHKSPDRVAAISLGEEADGRVARAPIETLVTIELRRAGNETELTLTHEGLPDDEARTRHEGWRSILEKLATIVGEP